MAKKPDQPKSALELIEDKSDIKGKQDGKFRKQVKVQVNPKASLEDVKSQETLQVGNKQNTLQEALNRGLHAKGEVVLESAETVYDGLNTMEVLFTYAVPVVPASLDNDPSDIDLPIRREADKRESVRQSRLRAASDPAGFDAE